MLLWIRRIRPFYLYHAFNWQSILCLAPVIVFFAGPYLLIEAWGVDHFTIFMLSICMGAAGLLKQVAIYGIAFLFTPADLDPRSTKWAEKILDKLRPRE